MNQVFRISVGPETVKGALPPARVGLGFCCRFIITGVDNVADVPTPKIWVSRKEAATVFWEAVWDADNAYWVATVSADAAANVGNYAYALTMFGADIGAEFIAGQGAFGVYSSIASPTGGTGATGGTGLTVDGKIAALEARIVALEDWRDGIAGIAQFDAANAFEYELRQQVADITNILKGS